MNHSDTKQFAFEVLDVIDDLVKPEIKYSFIEKFWHFFTGYAKKKILNKPDNEIIEKLLIIQRKLNSKFSDLEKSVEINLAQKLGSPQIPKVGDLEKIRKLTIDPKALEKELFRI